MADASRSAVDGLKTRRDCDWTTVSSTSVLRRRFPSKLIWLIVGNSVTLITSVLPRGSSVTSSNRPDARMR